MLDGNCEYGCGQKARYILKNGKRICSSSHNQCPVNKQKNSQAGTGKVHNYTDESRKRLSEKIKKYRADPNSNFNTEEYIRKQRESNKKVWADPNSVFNSEEYRNKHLRKMKEVWSDEAFVEKMKKVGAECGKVNFKGKKHTEKARRKMGLAQKERWKDPEYRRVETQRRKDNFKDEDYLKSYIKGCTSSPNKQELFLIELLDDIGNVEYEFVGDFSIWIGGKNPDFINERHKKIIEYFGDYWHSEKVTNLSEDVHERGRISHFNEHGYKCLVIWGRELKNIKKLKDKIDRFNRE